MAGVEKQLETVVIYLCQNAQFLVKCPPTGEHMPIYEFACNECGKSFEDLVMSLSRINEVVCPTCGSGQVKKKMSTFASKAADGGSSYSFNGGSAAACTTST